MTDIIFIDDPNDIYIHKIQEKLDDLHIHENKPKSVHDIPDEPYTHIILSIDIGILHLGISVGLVDDEFNLKEIAHVDLVDITEYTHIINLNKHTCDLYHTKCIADWMEHIFHEHKELFEEAHYILIERQPPQGLVAIEQIIHMKWRDKTYLISPNSMHKHFHIGHYDYDERKEHTTKIATTTCYWHPRAIERYEMYERKHDICDSICLMKFWLHKANKQIIEEKRLEYLNNKTRPDGVSYIDWLDTFKYKNIL